MNPFGTVAPPRRFLAFRGSHASPATPGRPAPRRGRNRGWGWEGISAVLLAALTASQGLAAEPRRVTTAGLLEEMTDLAGMAEWPQPAYTCRQFSSYDRKSKSPAEEWFANADAGHFLRVEERDGRKEHVMMDAAGPGAIVRIWSANPAGTIRLYLDGAEQPVIEAPMDVFLGGKFPGLARPLAGEYSKGWNLYFPLPYARSCKVTSDAGGFYYHINYRTYAEDTSVESFRREMLETLAPQIQKVAGHLAEPARAPASNQATVERFEFSLPAGDRLREVLPGPAAISRVVLRISAANLEKALRGLVVKIHFDDEACVESPVGDLFGSAPGINPFRTLPVGMAADGELYCHWFMPFRSSALIELVNHTDQAVSLTGDLYLQDYTWTERSMYFRAKWRAQMDVPTRPMIDWNYLAATGQGVFAGVAFAIDNPVRDWWGEGDEKIYVDEEAFPSHFGTGTEDYYGYAWCWPGLFTHAYHAQPRCDGPGNYGRTSVNRFHVLDRIPFTRSFKFDMELWHWNEKCKVNMAVVAYWYARPGSRDTFLRIRPEDTVLRPMPEYVAPRVAGALEGEQMRIVRVTGTAAPQEWGDLSAGSHLWWHAGMKPGDTLVVAFAAPKAGRYRVMGYFLRARDYGIHQLAINGRKTGDPMDFYQPEVKPSGEIDLGTFELKAGENELSVTVIGANEKALKAYMFGLDYLLLKPVQ